MKPTVMLLTAGLVALGSASQVAAAPAWCKGASFSDDVEMRDLASEDPSTVVIALAHATCAPTAEAAASSADIEKSRQAWGARLGMNDGDWADVIAWANANGGRQTRLELSTKDVTQFTPLDQYKAIVDGFHRPGGEGDWKDFIYVADAFDPSLSQVGRYAAIKECLKAESSIGSHSPPAATWALCQGDIERFDAAKLAEELRADAGHGGDVKMMIRFDAAGLAEKLKEHAEAVKAAGKQDPVYQKMFDVAAAARKEWEAGLGKDRKLLDLVLQMDSAFLSGSRRQYEGCQEKTAAALAAAVAKVPASAFKAMKDERFDPYGGFVTTAGPVLLANPEVNLAAAAFVMCTPKTGTGDFLATYLQDTVGYRGPRTAAFSKMLAEKLTLDDMNEKIAWPDTGRPYRRSGGTMGSEGGVVASVKPEGELLTVSLEKLIVKQNECVESHRTSKIRQILPDGTLVYDLVCDKMGIVSHDQTWGDFHIRKEFAAQLRPGVKFSSVLGENGADVIVTWPSKTTEMPTWLLGASVK